MNKKLLVASLFAILLLMLPMTSVVGVSDVSLNRMIEKIEDNYTITETYDNEDCGCQDSSSQHLVNLERLLDRLESYSKIILLLYKFYPGIAEESKELSNRITLLIEKNEELKPYIPSNGNIIICIMIYLLILQIAAIWTIVAFMIDIFRDNPVLYNIFASLYFTIQKEVEKLANLYGQLDCPDISPFI